MAKKQVVTIVILAVALLSSPVSGLSVTDINSWVDCDKLTEIDDTDIMTCSSDRWEIPSNKKYWLGYAMYNSNTIYLNNDEKKSLGIGVVLHELGHANGMKHGDGGVVDKDYVEPSYKFHSNTKWIVNQYSELKIINYSDKGDVKYMVHRGQPVVYPYNDSFVYLDDTKLSSYLNDSRWGVSPELKYILNT